MSTVLRVALAISLVSAVVSAQSAPPARNKRYASSHHKTEDMVVNRAQITFDNGQLRVVANNNSLADTLAQIRDLTSTRIEGVQPGASDTVSGDFGPDTPRAVMGALLATSHYNFILISAPGKPGSLQRIVLSEPTPDTAPAPVVAEQTAPPAVRPASQIPAAAKSPEPLVEGAPKSDADAAAEPKPSEAPAQEASAPTEESKPSAEHTSPVADLPPDQSNQKASDDTPAIPVIVQICGVTYDASQLANVKVPDHCDKPSAQVPAKPSK